MRMSRSLMAVGLAALALSSLAGCPEGNNGEVVISNNQQDQPVQQLLVAFDQQVVVPTSSLAFTLKGTERLVASKVIVDFDGQLGGQAFTWSYEAEASDVEQVEGPADAPGEVSGLLREEGDTGDIVIVIPVGEGLWSQVGGAEASFSGEIALTVVDFFGEVTAEGKLEQVDLSFTNQITPNVTPIGGGDVYLDELLEVTGEGFLRPEEGETIARVEQGVLRYEGGEEVDVTGQEVALRWDGNRQRARLHVDPRVFGVRVASFEGDVRYINVLRDGTTFEGNTQERLTFDIQQSFISTLGCGDQDPCPGGARGQRIEIKGRGLVDSRDGVAMTLRFEGTFTPDKSSLPELDLTGEGALERAPDEYIDDQKVALAVWYTVVNDGGRPFLTGLGANPGTFSGTITPKLRDAFGNEQDGLPWSGEFRVLPTRQVVYLKYLPRFSRGLEKYGLRNVENEIRDRIREVAQAPYRDFNVAFVDEPPTDYVDYATIELSGPDPYGRNAFGYDNSFNGVAKDTDNLFLADYIGGWSEGSKEEFDNPFGGIYIESFDYFSPTLSAERNGGEPNEGASEDFDRILGPFMPGLGGDPVRGTEWPDGPRAAQIEEAIDMVGNVIGNTVAHEVGHSMGMSFESSDRVRPGSNFHNRSPGDGALMDSGGSRPFDERAAINGTPAAVFNATNARYLGEILPGAN